jgi:hypothetical protein
VKSFIDSFWVSFFGRVIVVMVFVDLIATIGLVSVGRVDWLMGIWFSAIWSFVNVLVMWRITGWWLQVKQVPAQRWIRAWSVLKFPVLYLVGFWLIVLSHIRMAGVFVGLSAFLIGLVVVQLLSARQENIEQMRFE